MKKILLTIALLMFMFSCTTEVEYPDPPETIEVGLSFNKWINNVSVSKMTASTEFTKNHILSNSTNATITIISNNKSSPILSITSRMDEIVKTKLTLTVGEIYYIDMVYDKTLNDTLKRHDNGLAFDAISSPTLITEDLTTILMECNTNQSLVLLDKMEIDTAFVTRFSDGSLNEDNKAMAWKMFDSEFFWYLYVTPYPETEQYLVQYKILNGNIKNIVFKKQDEFPVFISEEIYFISEVEEGNTSLSFDYDNIFGNLIIVGFN